MIPGRNCYDYSVMKKKELLLEDFNYHLPPERIAQKPARPRDHSRLLLLDKKSGHLKHEYFYDIVKHLRSGDLLVLNNSKVFPARLRGLKEGSGGRVEIFLHERLTADTWECLLKGRIHPGMRLVVSPKLSAVALIANDDGTWRVRFNLKGSSFWQEIARVGEVPLPPYIKRSQPSASDRCRYQTVFADDHKVGSAAAPTAGLHLTQGLLKKIKSKGVKIAYVTLHVGLGTFAPVKENNVLEHKMHSEAVEIPAATIKAVLEAKRTSGRVVAVGTTSCRSLESLDWQALASRNNKKQVFRTEIFIYPSYRFQVVDALITNFHLPKSTLMMLVSALAGREAIMAAYDVAINRGYRFFSYGDAMFIY